MRKEVASINQRRERAGSFAFCYTSFGGRGWKSGLSWNIALTAPRDSSILNRSSHSRPSTVYAWFFSNQLFLRFATSTDRMYGNKNRLVVAMIDVLSEEQLSYSPKYYWLLNRTSECLNIAMRVFQIGKKNYYNTPSLSNYTRVNWNFSYTTTSYSTFGRNL